MNLFSSRLVLRPRMLTEVLDLAAPFCVVNGGLLARLSLWTLGPLAIFAAALRLGLGWGWAGVWLTIVPLALLLEGVFTIGLGEALFRSPAEVRATVVVGRFLRRLPVLVLLQIWRLLLMSGCALVLVPLIMEGPRWLFLDEALLLEQAGPGEAIRRSRALSRDRQGFCLGLAAALLAAPLALVFLVDLMGGTLLGSVLQLGRPLGALTDDGGSGFAVLGLLLSVPVSASMRFLGYIDLRTRKEGWDIQLRFAAWAEREKDPDRWAAA